MSSVLSHCPKPVGQSSKWQSQVAAESPEVVVAVMGMTGAGKSSLIKAITGAENISIGHGLKSTTAEVASYRCTIDGVKFVLVDTPGFNDTFRSDREILQQITEWLTKTYASGKQLNGLLYLHPIVNTRVEGSSLLSLRTFRELCGKDCYKHIFLCTTFWDIVDKETGGRREKELCDSEDIWGHMQKNGSSVHRLRRYAEASGVLLKVATLPPIVLSVQREVVEQSLPIESTGAGMVVDQQSKELKQKLEQQIRTAKDAAARKLAHQDAANTRRLKKEEARVESLRQQQAKLFKEQRVQNERLHSQLREAAEQKLQKERAEIVRLQTEAKQKERARLQERTRLEAESRRQAEAVKAQEARWKRIDRRRRLTLIWQFQGNLYARARAMGIIRAKVLGMEDQSDAFTSCCDYCHRLIGFQCYYTCKPCGYDVCESCYRGNSLESLGFAANHYVRHFRMIRPNVYCCKRLRPEDPAGTGSYGYIDCEGCGKRCEGLCFHCCFCNYDDFDLCLECVTIRGATCHSHSHWLHPMFAPLPT